MKKLKILLLILTISFSGIIAQTSSKTRTLKPENYRKKVTTVISDKNRAYYSLSSKKASVISVKGPGILRVLTRGRFSPKQADKIEYKILYTINGGEELEYNTSRIKRSKKATYLNGSLGVPGQLESFEIELERGYHTIEFKLADNSIPVAVRYKFTRIKAKKQKWLPYSPKLYLEPVYLVSREATTNYYRFTTEKPLVIEINGPTELRVLTRSENQFNMRGRIHYRLQIKENNEIINTYQLSSKPSEITTYKTNNEIIPGKACEFVIIVPKGKHKYEVIPLDKDKKSVLARLFIPEKDVKLIR